MIRTVERPTNWWASALWADGIIVGVSKIARRELGKSQFAMNRSARGIWIVPGHDGHGASVCG